MRPGATRARLIAGIVLSLVLALGGQAMADSLVPDASGQDTNAAVGRAASSYLTGVKRYAAAALWNRIDPLMHNYYEGVELGDMHFMLSTITAVQALDPGFTQSYYVGAWILVESDRLDEGLAMAEQGVHEVSTSGLLLTNLAQIQYLYARDVDSALDTALAGLDPGIAWGSASEQYSGYMVFRDISKAKSRDDLVAFIDAELTRLDAEIEADPDESDHDHDHDDDGVADH